MFLGKEWIKEMNLLSSISCLTVSKRDQKRV